MPNDLIKLETCRARAVLAQAREVLARVRDAADAKQVAEVAHAAKIALIRQGAREAAAECHEVEVDALTVAGDFLNARPMNRGERGQFNGRDSSGGSRRQQPEIVTPTLADLGFKDRKMAATAEALAVLRRQDPGLHARVRAGKATVPEGVQAVRRREKADALRAKAAAAPPLDEDSARVITADCVECRSSVGPGTARLIFLDSQYNEGVNYGRGEGADR